MAKDGTDPIEIGDRIALRAFRSKHSAGNDAMLARGKRYVTKLLLT
jgi:hypothetical protein